MNFFNPDNAFFSFVNKLCDVVVLSLICTLCCLPIITIGPSICALYYATVKTVRRERSYAVRSFFHAFKLNFKVGAMITILCLLLAYVLYIDYQYASLMREQGETIGTVLYFVFNVVAFLAACMLVWIFPILSRFTVGVKQLLKNAFFISIKHLPSTLLLLLLVGGMTFLTWLIIPGFLVLPGLCTLLCSFPIERVMKKYMPKPEGTPEETGEDQWYLE